LIKADRWLPSKNGWKKKTLIVKIVKYYGARKVLYEIFDFCDLAASVNVVVKYL